MHGIDLARWPGLVAFTRTVRERESVRLVLSAEGLAGDEAAS
jgi:hypothetical protein